MPYRWTEIWTRKGREAYYRRWLETRAKEVRASLLDRGLTSPGDWSSIELSQLHEVLVDRCYDVEGFAPGPNGVVVDAGCGFGDFTLLSAASRSRVIAFDPIPENVRLTKELLHANGLEAEVHPVALGDHPGTIRLGRMGPIMLSIHGSGEARDVPVWTLDSLGLSPVTLLKIDVEGMEARVLAGAETVLRRDRPKIIVEVHGEKPAREVGEFLRKLGYRLIPAGPQKRFTESGSTHVEFWAPPDP